MRITKLYGLFEVTSDGSYKRVSEWCSNKAAAMEEARGHFAVIYNRDTGDTLASGYKIKVREI